MAHSPSSAGLTATPPEGVPGVGRNITALAGAQVVTWSMALLWTLVVPRALGPSGMGTMMAAWAATAIFGLVLGLGTRNYLVRESVVDRDGAPRLLGTAVALRIALAPVLFAAAFVYGEVLGWDGEARTVLYLAAAATVFVQIAEPLHAGFQATERMEYLAYSEVITKSAQGLVGIVVVLIGFGAVGVTASWTTMAAVVVVLNAYWLRGLIRIDLRTSVRRMIAIVRDSVAYWLFGVFFMLYLWIDFVMLSLMTRPEVVGWYSVPMKLFQTLMFLPAVVSTAWLPRFVRGFERGEVELRRTARQPVELVLLLSLPICAATMLAAEPAIGLLYGDAYAESVPVLVILALCLPPMYVNILLSQVLIAMKRQSSWTWVMAAATVVNPLFNLGLIRATEARFENGAIGAATALLLTEAVVVSAGLALVGRRILDRQTVRRGIAGVAAAAGAFGVGYAARAVGPVASLLAGGAAFPVLAWALRVFTADEVALFKACLRRVGGMIALLGRRAATAAAASGVHPPA